MCVAVGSRGAMAINVGAASGMSIMFTSPSGRSRWGPSMVTRESLRSTVAPIRSHNARKA